MPSSLVQYEVGVWLMAGSKSESNCHTFPEYDFFAMGKWSLHEETLVLAASNVFLGLSGNDKGRE